MQTPPEQHWLSSQVALNDKTNHVQEPARAQMLDEVQRLRGEQKKAHDILVKLEDHGGLVFEGLDWVKSHLGSARNNGFVEAMWGVGLVGSKELEMQNTNVNMQLDSLARDAQTNHVAAFMKDYRLLTEQSFLAGHETSQPLSFFHEVKLYDRNQERMVESIMDGAAALAAAIVEWKFRGPGSHVKAVIAASLTKVLVDRNEPLYRDVKRDALTGAFDGLALVVGNRVGGATANLMHAQPRIDAFLQGKRLLTAFTSEGVSGSVFGVATGPVREYYAAKDSDTSLTARVLLGAAKRNALAGFVLGVPFGLRAAQ